MLGSETTREVQRSVDLNHETVVSDPLTAYFEASRGALSRNTMRALRADIQAFTSWCRQHSEAAFPASPKAVAAFVDGMAQEKSPATVRRYVATIATVHKAMEQPNPLESTAVRFALQRMHRRRGRRQAQVQGLTWPLRNRLLAAAGERLIDTRNRALLAAGYDTLLRRAELVALAGCCTAGCRARRCRSAAARFSVSRSCVGCLSVGGGPDVDFRRPVNVLGDARPDSAEPVAVQAAERAAQHRGQRRDCRRRTQAPSGGCPAVADHRGDSDTPAVSGVLVVLHAQAVVEPRPAGAPQSAGDSCIGLWLHAAGACWYIGRWPCGGVLRLSSALRHIRRAAAGLVAMLVVACCRDGVLACNRVATRCCNARPSSLPRME